MVGDRKEGSALWVCRNVEPIKSSAPLLLADRASQHTGKIPVKQTFSINHFSFLLKKKGVWIEVCLGAATHLGRGWKLHRWTLEFPLK